MPLSIADLEHLRELMREYDDYMRQPRSRLRDERAHVLSIMIVNLADTDTVDAARRSLHRRTGKPQPTGNGKQPGNTTRSGTRLDRSSRKQKNSVRLDERVRGQDATWVRGGHPGSGQRHR